MAFWVSNPMALLADFVAPLIIGFWFAWRWGAARGTAYALVPLLVVVLALFFLQVSPGVNPDGSTRLQSALGWALGRNRRGAVG